jgi:hypothetical protein
MPKPKTLYAVGAIRTELELDTCLGTSTVPLKWADGMIGAVPVFSNKRKARRYAAGAPIAEMREVPDAT